jgi:hypothetical protein
MTTERRLAMPSTGTLVALQSLIGAGLSIPYLIAAVHVGDGEAYSISWARWASLGFWMSMAGVNAAGFTLALWLRGQPQGEPVNRLRGRPFWSLPRRWAKQAGQRAALPWRALPSLLGC